jgi:acyl-coenzyme A thioesterase PaaI-like protein
MGFWQERLDVIVDGTGPLPSVNEHLELGRLTSWREGFVEKDWEVKPHFCTAEGTPQQALFGGYLGALADQVLSLVSMTVMEDTCQFRTVDLKIAFFNKIRVGPLKIEARVVNKSRMLLHCEAEFMQNGKLMAKASAVQAITDLAAGVRT